MQMYIKLNKNFDFVKTNCGLVRKVFLFEENEIMDEKIAKEINCPSRRVIQINSKKAEQICNYRREGYLDGKKVNFISVEDLAFIERMG